jgi:serine/threonine protein kinase
MESSRLNREFVVLREVACDGVVRALDYGVEVSQGIDYLVLTRHGPSLAVVMGARPERLTTETALAIGYSAASALGQLHTLGWCHGDLKPGNLLCDVQGKLVLSDLEFACRVDRTDAYRVGVDTAGTPPFMAPELLREVPAEKSKASDVWALGVTLYLALFGEYPFGHGEAGEIRDAIGRGSPTRLAEIPEPLQRLLLSFIAVNPQDRCRHHY